MALYFVIFARANTLRPRELLSQLVLYEQCYRLLSSCICRQMGTPVSAIGTSPSVPATRPVPFVITQTELHSEVLSDLVAGQTEGETHQRWVTGVLVECVRSVG